MKIEFAPVVYEHAAKFINKSPWEVSGNSELLYKAHLEAYRKYDHSPVVVGIDIYNLEAEAYGAVINEPAQNEIPSIASPPLSSIQDILELKPIDPKKDKRLPLVIKTGQKLKEQLLETDIKIPVSGPFSIAGNLVGTENLVIESVMSPDLVQRALEHLTINQLHFCEEIVQKGLGITFFESAASPPLISPQTFKDVLLPSLKKIFQTIYQMLKQKPAFIIGGNSEPILKYILEIGANYIICPAETDQNKFMETMEQFPDRFVRINMNANVLISDQWAAVEQEIDRVLAIANNRKNVCIGTGIIPYETDPNFVLRIKDYIANKT